MRAVSPFTRFPAHDAVAHPRTGEQVRWRMHEVNVQRAVRAAATEAGLVGKATPHVRVKGLTALTRQG